MIKIHINKAIEEFDILGQVYQMDMSDEAINRYRKAWKEFDEKTTELQLREQKGEDVEEEYKQLFVGLYNLFLGLAAYQKIYNDVGRSTIIMADILKQIIDVIDTKYNAKDNQQKHEKYLHKKQRRQR